MDLDAGDILEEVEEIEEIEVEQDLGTGHTGTSRKREPHERITKPVLGRLAKAKLIAARAKSLEMNRPSTIPRSRLKSTEPQKIAEQEFDERVLPLKIIRNLPDGTYEEWTLKDFKYFAR
jgi:DNA-directed RNA polymerase I, II, and III subunit RPABC2